MDNDYLEKLRQFRDTVKALAEGDSDQMRHFAKVTCDHISDCTVDENSDGKALEILKDCLERLKDTSQLHFQQMRTDILFALDLCIGVVENAIKSGSPQEFSHSRQKAKGSDLSEP